ncbi:hypothetical protein D3C78_1885680 [compost metagenome]
MVTEINEPINTISCPHRPAWRGICSFISCIVVSSGNRNSRNSHRSDICTIRPNLKTKLNSESRTRVRNSSVSELNGAGETE